MDNSELEPVEEAQFEELDVKEEADIAQTPGEDNKSGHSNYPTQLALAIRAIVGGYVLYLAYQLMTSENELTTLMWIFAGVFVIAGSGLVIMSIKHFLCGEYEGGKKDV